MIDRSIVDFSGSIKRRSGFKFVAKFDSEVIRLEAIERGDWTLVKVYLRDGSVRYVNSDGPVVINGDLC